MSTNRSASLDAKAYLGERGPGRSFAKFRKDQIVFSQREPADCVFYVRQGKFKATVLSERGKEAVVSILGPGDFFGEACIAGQARRLMTVSALTDATVVRIGKGALTRMLHERESFSDLFMSHVLNRTIRVEADLVDQLFNSSERRLARLLLLLANYGKEGRPEPILAKISQETLAKMIGTTRSRVSFFMNKFRNLGLIAYNGHIEVHKSLLNLVLHEQPHIDMHMTGSGEQSGSVSEPGAT
jgi:CRP-like cAMP-binding protein